MSVVSRYPIISKTDYFSSPIIWIFILSVNWLPTDFSINDQINKHRVWNFRSWSWSLRRSSTSRWRSPIAPSRSWSGWSPPAPTRWCSKLKKSERASLCRLKFFTQLFLFAHFPGDSAFDRWRNLKLPTWLLSSFNCYFYRGYDYWKLHSVTSMNLGLIWRPA